MKTRYTRISRALAAIFIIASFVIPAGMAPTSRVSADPGIMRWDTIVTPEAVPQKNDVDNVHFPGTASANNPKGSETISMAVGNDGKTIAWVVRDFQYLDSTYPAMYRNVLYGSNTSGISATTTKEQGLLHASGFILGIGNLSLNSLGNGLPSNCYQVVIASDDPKIMAVTADGTSGGEYGTGFGGGPRRIYESSDAGATWNMAFDGSILSENESIRNLDISIDYGGKRDVGFVTTRGIGGADPTKSGRWFIRSTSGYSWMDQTASPNVNMPDGLNSLSLDDNFTRDFYAIKFSPTYNGDSSVALVAATDNGTYYNIAQRDVNQNYTLGWAFGTSINIRNGGSDSPHIATLNNVCMQLPSDFSGQSSSLRRAYISLDAYGNKANKLIGASDNGSTLLNANTVHYQQFTASTTGVLALISIYCGANGSVKVGLYSDSGNMPNTLLASNNSGTSVTATGWRTIPLTSTYTIASGTKYWLAVLGDTLGACTERIGITGANYYEESVAYATGLPATATPINHSITEEVSIQGWTIGVQDGIYRIDDTQVNVLMDTSSTINKSIYSIAFFGTYASGKLLAGERRGFPCTATVPTWFTDSPTQCPVPCWFPALKATTGAANQGGCLIGSQNGTGAAIVGWNADGSLGLVSTGSLPAFPSISQLRPTTISGGMGGAWWGAWSDPSALPTSYDPALSAFSITTNPLDPGFTQSVIHDDESAFAISRNNGETWNQLSLIDTTIDWFNDVAAAPDCTTIYLASVSANTGLGCNEFDSVWRSTINPNVASPLAAIPPIGIVWERVYCRTTSGSCNVTQSEKPILRVVKSCTDRKDGEIVGWAAQNAKATNSANSGGVMAWSPDFGDYWASITPRYPVQDFVFESSTTIYALNTQGVVQRLPYTGTSWSTNLPSYDTQLQVGHSIAAVPNGRVLVGAGVNAPYPAAYSLDKAVTFNVPADPIPNHGNEHVIFDVDFTNNRFIYMADDSPASTGLGTVYRNTIPSLYRWVDNDMMSAANGSAYVFANSGSGTAPNGLDWPAGNNPPHVVGQYGIVQAFTGDPQPALYSAHDNITNTSMQYDSAVCRTLKPRDGMPKPGIQWACLDVFAPLTQKNVFFTLEPSSLKACGCCTLDTNTTLYAIDNESGGHWNGHWVYDGVSSYYDPDPGARLGYSPSANQGMLWAFTDCLAKKGPALKSPADQHLVGADPVSGRNQQIDLAWEQLCLTIWYQCQIAKDKDFTLRIDPSQNWDQNGGVGVITAVKGSLLFKMDSTNNTSPAAWIPPGALPEAGAIYYWRIRSAKSATTQIANSPWSEVRSFIVKAGFIVNTPYYGVQLFSPANGGIGVATKPTQFSWSPWKEATKYEFNLAKDSEFKQMVTTANTTTTAYSYSGALDYATSYFWRVKALEVNGRNIPSDWSATFSFQTEAAPAAPSPAPAEPVTPLWVWALIAIGIAMVIITLILILQTRRV